MENPIERLFPHIFGAGKGKSVEKLTDLVALAPEHFDEFTERFYAMQEKIHLAEDLDVEDCLIREHPGLIKRGFWEWVDQLVPATRRREVTLRWENYLRVIFVIGDPIQEIEVGEEYTEVEVLPPTAEYTFLHLDVLSGRAIARRRIHDGLHLKIRAWRGLQELYPQHDLRDEAWGIEANLYCTCLVRRRVTPQSAAPEQTYA